MKKTYYSTEFEKDELVSRAKQNGWILKEKAITIHGKYLVFDTRPEVQQAQNSMEIFNAMSTMNTNNEIKQATMLMEILNMIAALQGGE